MASVTTHQYVTIRAYDGSVTPKYIEITQYDYPTLPGRREIPPTAPVAGGGKVSPGNIAYIVPDELPLLNPVEFTITFNMESEKLWQLDALGNPREKASWTVGTSATVWSPIAPGALGNVTNSLNESVPLPAPIFAQHLNHLFNLEVRASVPANAPSGVIYVHRLVGCACNGFDWAHQQGPLTYPMRFLCFGAIDTKQADFTAGVVTT